MLPIVDFSPFLEGSTAQRRTVADAIGSACAEHGFLYIRNHGVPEDIVASARDAQRAYFARPEDEKRRLTRARGRYRGYIPVLPFATTDGHEPILYEAFIAGTEIPETHRAIKDSNGIISPNLWPELPAEFAPAMRAYWDAVTELSQALLRAYAMALGRPEETLLPEFDVPISNMSVLHYLKRESVTDGPDDVKPHRDTNALTILLPGTVGGLEVQGRDGRFRAAPPVEGCYVVNTGNMMEVWSGGRFRSTMHRVHPPKGTDRYSLAYFAAPNYETVVAPLVSAVSTDADLSPIHAGRALEGFVSTFDRCDNG